MLRECANYFKILIIFLSFAIPFTVLYYLDAQSFNLTWKGRTFYLFFIWLFVLELVLNWEKYRSETASKLSSTKRIFALCIALLLPTVYVVVANFFGLNVMIVDLARQFNVPWVDWMPLSTEYLVFTVFFALIVLLAYGLGGLTDFSLSTFFLGAIGVVYMIDNLYPCGRFTPFQIFVPTTATLATNVLNSMGYHTLLQNSGSMPDLAIWDSQGKVARFSIAWPCSGVESLLIYTVTVLLFLKKIAIPWKKRIIYFMIGATVTYFINVLRIVTIFVIAIDGGDYMYFHDYYGQLYSITWIMSYLLIIMGSRILWSKIKSRTAMAQNFRCEPKMSNAV